MPNLPIAEKRPRLLVVDDQPINIQTLFEIFDADCDVFMATSGKQALAFAVSEPPDLILLDVVMPEMDGHEVCRQLKANEQTRDIPVIFVTAHSEPQQETQGLQLGAVDFISKPVSASVVRARVRSHLLLKHALEQVKELNDSLEKKVAHRTAELEFALQKLASSQDSLARSEAKAAIGMLVASVSHELATPLGNGLIAAGTLKQESSDFSGQVESGALKRSELLAFVSRVATGSDMILQNLRRASDMLGHFKQVAADQVSEQIRSFDLRQMLDEIFHTLAPSMRRTQHQLLIDVPPGIRMNSQPGALGQVIINLVNNAILHAFSSRAQGTLSLRANVCADRVVITVADDGVGMGPSHLSQLFNPFFSTRIGQGGTGLGMAIVHRLVTKSLRGDINVESTPGQGTCFTITLPMSLPNGEPVTT